MKQLRIVMLAGVLCLAATAANASTDLGSVRVAVKKSAESLRSGYGYFVAAHMPDALLIKAVKDEAAQQAKEAQKDGKQDAQPVVPKTFGTVARSYWAFSGDKWRYDWTTIFPEDRAGGLTQVAWDGTNATSQVGDKGFSWTGMGHARQQAMLEMIDPLATGLDREALNDTSAKYVGDEQIDGENTHHVTARTGSLSYDLWISPSHGYQTKRMLRTFDPGMGKVSDYRVESFKLYDGIWIPESTVEMRYDREDGKLVNPDIRRFRTIEFHANVPVADSEFQVKPGTYVAGPDPGKVAKLLGQPMKQDEIHALLASPGNWGADTGAKPAETPAVAEKPQAN